MQSLKQKDLKNNSGLVKKYHEKKKHRRSEAAKEIRHRKRQFEHLTASATETYTCMNHVEISMTDTETATVEMIVSENRQKKVEWNTEAKGNNAIIHDFKEHKTDAILNSELIHADIFHSVEQRDRFIRAFQDHRGKVTPVKAMRWLAQFSLESAKHDDTWLAAIDEAVEYYLKWYEHPKNNNEETLARKELWAKYKATGQVGECFVDYYTIELLHRGDAKKRRRKFQCTLNPWWLHIFKTEAPGLYAEIEQAYVAAGEGKTIKDEPIGLSF